MRLATTSWFSGKPLKLKETNVSKNHNSPKTPNWWEAHQFAIYKPEGGVELWSTQKQLQLSGQRGS